MLAVLFAFGCRSGSQSPITSGPPAANNNKRVVNDDLQRRVAVPIKVTRAVSLAPSVTENVFAVGAGDRLVGVTTFCNYPEEAKSIAKIGDTMTPNMETIVALKPDVVLVSTASQIEAFTKTLEANGIAVYVSNPTTLDGVLNGLESLGHLFGTEEMVDRLVPALRQRVGDVSLKAGNVQKVRVFVQISREPLFTIGNGSFLNDVIERAGGESVTAGVEAAFPKLSPEAAVAYDPDAIIISDSSDNQEPNGAFKNSPAVKNRRVYKINADILSRPGPRLVDALEQIAKLLHPEKFH
jgi:iron complex transport system substrate-binding protein